MPFDTPGLIEQIGTGIENPAVNTANGPYSSFELADILTAIGDALEFVSDKLGFVIDVVVTPIDFPDPDWGRQRRARPDYETFRGVSVTATNADDVDASSVGQAWVGHHSALELSASGLVTANQTRAYIEAGAQVSADNASADSNQDVRVAASNDTSYYGVAGAISAVAAAVVGVGASMDAVFIRNLTEAWVAGGADVQVGDDLEVRASQRERVFAAAAGFSGKLLG